MSWLLKLLPAPYRWLAMAGALAALAALGWAWGEGREAKGFQAGHDAVMARWAEDTARLAAAALKAQALARAEETRRTAAQQEAVNAAQAQVARARADADRVAAAAERLQQRAAALIAAAGGGAAPNQPATAGSQAAQDAAGVLADVLGRCAARVRLLAELADERAAAGQACERSYDALTPAQPDP